MINSLERDKDFKEEQFDYVQQSLRAIALRHGASLIFTSHSRPESFVDLRSYLLHRMFAPPATSSSSVAAATVPNGTTAKGVNGSSPAAATAAPVASATASRAFGFNLRANSVDRDQLLVPAGWDSWGKIKILRERFDPEAFGKGWEADLVAAREVAAGRPEPDEREAVDEEGRRVVLAQRQYEDVIPDLSFDDQPTHITSHVVEAQDEQSFLKAHYDALQKEREKDPRAAFAARPTGSGSAGGNGEMQASVGLGYGAGVVGPMASAGLHLPSVERALDRVEGDDATARLAARMQRGVSAHLFACGVLHTSY